MILKKITPGFVIQTFDTDKRAFTSQEFVAGDQTDYETEDGDPINQTDFEERAIGGMPYLAFDMTQPLHRSMPPKVEKRAGE